MDAIKDIKEDAPRREKEEGSFPSSDPESAPESSHELDWEDDPRNPYNWSDGKRMYHTVCVALYAFTV
jgi:hypothetical protein